MSKITVELDVTEALTALGPIQDRRLAYSQMAAHATGDEREILDMSGRFLLRVERALTDALYPDRCRWMDDEECDRPIASDGLCRVHLSHRNRVAEIMA